MHKATLVLIAVFASLVVVGSGTWPFPSLWSANTGTTVSISFGSAPIEQFALIYIAEDRGFFAENGLNVTVGDYDSGPSAVSGMKNNEVNISVSAEYPIVAEAFKKENISIIGSISKSQTFYLIGRKDRGITKVSDLRGKRIGVPRGTVGEFYLGRFLSLNGMSLKDVIPVDAQLSKSANAIINGSLDADIFRDVNINQVKERLGSNIVVWPVQSSQSDYSVMVCKNGWIAGQPDTIDKVLKSLGQAEEYTIEHPGEAKAILQKRLHLDEAYVATVWPNHQFSLTLDQSLIAAMEDEGRWMINNNLTAQKTIPNFRKYIYTKGLQEVKLESVNILG